jgi:hypothetical protein
MKGDPMRTIGKQEMVDIVIGAGLLGAGGGGSIAEGMKLVDRVLEFGSGVQLASVEDLGDEDWGAVIAGMGSPVASSTRVRTHSPNFALQLLEEAQGFTSAFVMPFELGAGNSLNPMLVAVQRGISIIDGDPVGRAVPQIDMTTFHLGGLSLSPLALATEEKISAIIRTERPYDMERVARAITSELGGVAAFACHAMPAKEMKKHILPDTTTLVERIGETIRQAREERKDATSVLIEKFDGYLLGKGKVEKVLSETKGGFDFGTVEVEGDLPIRVMFQNENMIAFRGEKLLALVPDLICAVKADGTPLTNADIREGMEVSYIGFAANPAFRTPAVFGLFAQILGPLDYRGDFIPIETLMA